MQPSKERSPGPPNSQDRLDSWKQIAAYLGRSERTVRRWQEYEGLPVHRHLHRQRGSVWAFQTELDQWIEQRKSSTEPLAEAGTPRRRWGFTLGMAAAIAVACGATILWWPKGPQPVLQTTPITAFPGMEYGPTFSPDGQQVAFFWGTPEERNGIYLKSIGGDSATPLVTSKSDFCYSPAWSPDGKSIAYLRRNPEVETWLHLVSPSGGADRALLRLARLKAPGHRFWANNLHLSWTTDSRWIYAPMSDGPGRRGIYRISALTGEARQTTRASTGLEYAPALAPDGRSLAFLRIWEQPESDGEEVLTLSLKPNGEPDGQPLSLHKAPSMVSGLAWTPGGNELLFCRADRVTLPVSEQLMWRLVPLPGHQPSPVGISNCMTIAVYHAEAAEESILLFGSTDRQKSDIWQANPTKPDAAVPFAPSSRIDSYPSFSPDGKRVAFLSNRRGSAEIWTVPSDGGEPARITENAGTTSGPKWSPDGNRIVYASSGQILIVPATGGTPQRFPVPEAATAPFWSRDGQSIFYTVRSQFWRARADGSGRESVLGSIAGLRLALESPDGKAIYYCRHTDKHSLYRIPAGGGPEEIVYEGLLYPSFAFSARHVYFISSQDRSLQRIPLVGGSAERLGVLPGLATGRPPILDVGMAVAPDDSRILYVIPGPEEVDLHVVRNFR